jgi:hypothetical protein
VECAWVKRHLIVHYMPNREEGGSLPITAHRLIVVDHHRHSALEGKKAPQIDGGE